MIRVIRYTLDKINLIITASKMYPVEFEMHWLIKGSNLNKC